MSEERKDPAPKGPGVIPTTIHDPLCLADPATDNSRCHYCALIAKVRGDEKGLSDEDIFNDGQQAMLAKCIAAVKERVWYTPEISTIHAKSYEYGFSDCKERIVAALHALQETP
jgi:hypothetical protein